MRCFRCGYRSLGILGLAFGTGSAWLLVGSLAAVRAIDREVHVEEMRLSGRFGATYEAYRDRVSRYLPAVQLRTRLP